MVRSIGCGQMVGSRPREIDREMTIRDVDRAEADGRRGVRLRPTHVALHWRAVGERRRLLLLRLRGGRIDFRARRVRTVARVVQKFRKSNNPLRRYQREWKRREIHAGQ